MVDHCSLMKSKLLKIAYEDVNNQIYLSHIITHHYSPWPHHGLHDQILGFSHPESL